MTEVEVSNLVEKLIELGREIELNNEEAKHVFDMMKSFQKWKVNLENASQLDKSTQDWEEKMKDIRSVVYKAQDTIDQILVEANQQQLKHQATTIRAAGFCPCFNDSTNGTTVSRSTNGGTSAYRLSSNESRVIKSIRDSVVELKPTKKIIVPATQVSRSPPKTTHQPEKKNPSSEEDDSFGFEEEASTVINRLIGGPKNIETVPIIGMLGIGKSTLARKVSKDPRIVNEFPNCIWVDVSQTYNTKEILLKILGDLKKELDSTKTEGQLANEIRMSLDNGRCLIILDDVWNQNIVSFFFESIVPRNYNSHRIMITTRDEDVATHRNVHKLNILDKDRSWLLLEKKVIEKGSCPRPDFEEPGRAIAEKCGGLPFSIEVIAEDLAKKKAKWEWDKVIQDNIGESLIKREDLLKSVKKSYDVLSCGAKACFLYCATFPKDHDISAWKLIRLWIAEGFVEHDKNLTPEKQAENYLNDLTKKNLVMIKARTCDGRIKKCRIHNLLYEFCKKEASKEDLFHEFTKAHPDNSAEAIQGSNISRRLSIGSSSLYSILSSFSKEQRMENVRSFLCFGPKPIEMPGQIPKAIQEALPLVKVLDVESIPFNFPVDFHQLLHLRYVSFSGNIKAPPQHYGMFWYLETLIINTSTSHDYTTSPLEVDIWSMLRLRHLHTKVPAKLPSPSDKTSNTCHIQTLSAIAPQCCTKEVLARAVNLGKLGIRGDVVSLLSTNTSGLSELEMLEQLESLKIVSEFQYAGNTILRSVLPKNLRKLTFSGTQLDWSHMSILAKLAFLRVLKLKENAFKGQHWEAETNISFTSLQVLWIQKTDLKIWTALESNFPVLKRLVLISCEELVELPDSLAAIDDLQFIKLKDTPNAVASAKQIVENKRQDIKLTVIPPDPDNLID
ncbi:putative late blight resistance protein R1B-14 [Capsicum galapagoense]